MNERYAVVVKVRKQVNNFTDNVAMFSSDFVDLIDLKGHPQADEVDIDWFYNSETGEFSAEGEISYPEPIQEPPTPGDLYQAAALLNQAEILANQRQQDKVMAAILLEQVGGEANV